MADYSLSSVSKSEKVQRVIDRRSTGDGILITLKKGWSFTVGDDARVDGAESWEEAWEVLQTAKRFLGPYSVRYSAWPWDALNGGC